VNLPFYTPNLYYGKTESFYKNYAICAQAKYLTNSFYHTSSFTSLTKTKDLLFKLLLSKRTKQKLNTSILL